MFTSIRIYGIRHTYRLKVMPGANRADYKYEVYWIVEHEDGRLTPGLEGEFETLEDAETRCHVVGDFFRLIWNDETWFNSRFLGSGVCWAYTICRANS